MVPSPWPWIWERLKQEWNEAELANEAHRRGEDWLTDECFLYEEGKYDRPLRHLGKRDASGKFCNVGGQLVPMDEPLREMGTDLVPVRTPTLDQEVPKAPSSSAIPTKQPEPTPADPGALSSRTKKRKPQPRETSSARLAEAPASPDVPASATPRAIPNPAPTAAESSLGESTKQFARGFAKGVLEESDKIYRDTKELPERLAKTGREIVEDVQAGRKLRALAPIEAIGHSIQNASRDDVERLAHGVVDSARDWYHKPAKEKGESLGRATMSIASDAAISALTDGLGTVAGLRKAEKAAEAAEAAEHVRDASKAAGATTTVLSDVTVVSKGKIVGQGNVYLRPTIEKIESGGLLPRDTFTNREGLLPSRPAGYYKEYVHPTEGISGPGSQRIVRGAGGEMYYTPDHYKTFVPLNGSSSR